MSGLTDSLAVVPALEVHPLPYELYGRLGPVLLQGRHVQVVYEEDHVLPQRWSEHTLTSGDRRRHKESDGKHARPLTDVVSKWSFLDAICSLYGVALHCRKLLQLKQHLATIYLQCSTRNSLFAMVYFRC